MGIERVFKEGDNMEPIFRILDNGLKHAYEDTISSPITSDNLWSADFEIYTMLMNEDAIDADALYIRVLEKYNIPADKTHWLREWIDVNAERINIILEKRAKIRAELAKYRTE